MIWYIFWFLSVLVLAATAVVFSKAIRSKEEKIKPIYLLIAGVFLSCLLMIFPVHYVDLYCEWGTCLKALLVSAQDSIQFFTADADHSLIAEGTANLSGWIKEAYGFLCAMLIISAPLLTFGFVLSFFKGFTAQVRYLFHCAENTYVFSEINQNSVSLAESIHAENAKAILIFANTPKEEEGDIEDLLSRLKEIHAICFQEDISKIHLKQKTNGKETYFFAMCNDESRSLSCVLQLVQKYKGRENTRIFLFSSDIESELILNNLDKGDLIIRRINPKNAFMIHMLSSEGTLLFDSAIPQNDGQKEISALILGTGQFGKEILKGLVWYCQMDNYLLRIHAFDKDPNAQDQITAMCPELMDEKYNGIHTKEEAFYDIKVDSCDVNTATFREKVRKIGNISYAFVSLGNDSLNITTAVNLRMLFEQLNIHPEITAVVTDPEKCAALAHAADRNGTPYKIRFVGDATTIYSSSVIINSKLEHEALELHKRYNKGNPYGFYEFEYNYKSSMASVIHYEARKHCKIPGAGKSDMEVTPEDRETIEALEHKRWNAYMRAEGFIRGDVKNELGKMHPSLVDYGALSPEMRQIDSRIAIK